MSENSQENGEEEDENIMDYQTLNEKQMIDFKRIESHYSDIVAGHPVVLLRIIVMGTAGTGKTYLIKGVQGRLREMTEIRFKSPVLVVAPTGVRHSILME